MRQQPQQSCSVVFSCKQIQYVVSAVTGREMQLWARFHRKRSLPTASPVPLAYAEMLCLEGVMDRRSPLHSTRSLRAVCHVLSLRRPGGAKMLRQSLYLQRPGYDRHSQSEAPHDANCQ